LASFEVTLRGGATCEDGWVEVFGIRRRILLKIADVVVEGALIAAGLKSASVFYHPGVEVV
jgi:hypothetical protein